MAGDPNISKENIPIEKQQIKRTRENILWQLKAELKEITDNLKSYLVEIRKTNQVTDIHSQATKNEAKDTQQENNNNGSEVSPTSNSIKIKKKHPKALSNLSNATKIAPTNHQKNNEGHDL